MSEAIALRPHTIFVSRDASISEFGVDSLVKLTVRCVTDEGETDFLLWLNLDTAHEFAARVEFTALQAQGRL